MHRLDQAKAEPLLPQRRQKAAVREVGVRRLESNHARSLKIMNEIQGIARLKIHDGKLEGFKRVASQCMQVVM